MCYSALVNQHSKNLGFTYKARIQTDLFEELFSRRNDGGGEVIPAAMETAFLEDPSSAAEKRIAKLIKEYRKGRTAEYEQAMFVQAKRLADNERKLKTKVTKGAQEHVRVATDKIDTFKRKIAELQQTKLDSYFSRIYPLQYAPVVVLLDDELVVAPFRYHLRPKNQTAAWDRQFTGTYNARRDNLQGRNWKPIFEKNHGIVELTSFWERVHIYDYENRKPASKEEEDAPRIEIRFMQPGNKTLVAPCIFEINNAKDLLSSFAIITDDPLPEVAAAGHDRTPIFMKEKHLDTWFNLENELSEYDLVFDDKQATKFKPVAAA